MNKITSEELKVKILLEVNGNSTYKDNSTNFLEVNLPSTFDGFLELLNMNCINTTNGYIINLRDQKGENVVVDNSNFNLIKERVFTQKNKNEFYFVILKKEILSAPKGDKLYIANNEIGGNRYFNYKFQ